MPCPENNSEPRLNTATGELKQLNLGKTKRRDTAPTANGSFGTLPSDPCLTSSKSIDGGTRGWLAEPSSVHPSHPTANGSHTETESQGANEVEDCAPEFQDGLIVKEIQLSPTFT
jgi:hypothetical protein